MNGKTLRKTAMSGRSVVWVTTMLQEAADCAATPARLSIGGTRPLNKETPQQSLGLSSIFGSRAFYPGAKSIHFYKIHFLDI